MAAGLWKHEAVGAEPEQASTARWHIPLRFALTAGLRFRAHANVGTRPKGDISN